MGEISFDEDIAAMQAYTDTFGEDIPDRRVMSAEDVALVPDKCREAIARGKPLTLAEWGVPEDLPPDRVI